MRYSKISCILALSIILVLLITVATIPAQAGAEVLYIYPYTGKIGDLIKIDGSNFIAHQILLIYFSSDEAEEGDDFGEEVITYKQVAVTPIDTNGSFTQPIYFKVPDALTDGEISEDVHDGYYYIYAIYPDDPTIIKKLRFLVIDGEIELAPEKGKVGTQVQISGEGLRPDQEIAVKYDEANVDIVSGDSKTDGDGSFTCTIIIPASTGGNHLITVIDESGNTPEAEFSVESEITIEPTEQTARNAVNVSGTGFGKREVITITFDGNKLPTTPELLRTDHYGSFTGSFLVPPRDIYGTSKIEARGIIPHKAEALLIILASINLGPSTSLTSPGYVGMELTIQGAGFTPNSVATITYSNNDETIPVATATVDAKGNFWQDFTIPPSVAGSHVITATEGTSTVTATFIMESQAPPMPAPLVPEIASTAGARTYFDWEDVIDLSGVSYTLQVASDADFTNILLEREGLSPSEYTVAEEEKLESTEKEVPYYWRVKAVDGAFNESEWTHPRLFYVGFSWTAIPDWVWYIFYGLGALLLGILGFWVWRRSAK